MRIRKRVLIGLLAMAIGAGWVSRSIAQAAQETADYRSVTVFGHETVEASFAKALASGGGRVLFRRTSPDGVYGVSTQSRDAGTSACPAAGCSHKGYTAVVYVVSGAATLVLAGGDDGEKNAAVQTADQFGGVAMRPGESRRISQGDLLVVPPGDAHWFRDVQGPFRYLVVQTP